MISGKYRIETKKGYIKEYQIDTGKLLFQGGYSNCKKHGEGEEFYSKCRLKFKGEYRKGNKIQGKGYDIKGNIILSIERDGTYKEYYSSKGLKFEGEYLHGKRWNGYG